MAGADDGQDEIANKNGTIMASSDKHETKSATKIEDQAKDHHAVGHAEDHAEGHTEDHAEGHAEDADTNMADKYGCESAALVARVTHATLETLAREISMKTESQRRRDKFLLHPDRHRGVADGDASLPFKRYLEAERRGRAMTPTGGVDEAPADNPFDGTECVVC